MPVRKRSKRSKKLSAYASFKKEELPANFFSAFKKDALILANEKTRKFAKELSAEVKEIIRKQKYKWEPLSEDYLEHKERVGLDTRIYMATKEYVNKGIGYWEVGRFIFVGPKPGIHEPSGLKYEWLARIHEYGSFKVGIPARPLWRPLLSVAIRRSKTLRKEYYNAVARVARYRARDKKEIKVG